MEHKRLRVLIASFNTALQGNQGLPLDLVEWLTPTLSPTHSLPVEHQEPPDIVAVGFQELLPLHLGLAGLSGRVLSTRDTLIREQIEKNLSVGDAEPQKYSLVAKYARVGIALLVYARDETVARRIRDVQIQGVGCGKLGMGNKGAVGVRFRMSPEDGVGEGEIFTFITAHLAAHAYNLPQRIKDFQTIVSQLLFKPLDPTSGPSQIYSTSHLFVFGDLNFRLSIPAEQEHLSSSEGLERLREHDQLSVAKLAGKTLQGLHEGEFWKFKPTYKFVMGSEDQYHLKRVPSWTDRILFASYSDTPIEPLLYTSIQSYTTSDHKPIIALLLLPPLTDDSKLPLLKEPAPFPVYPHAYLWSIIGTLLDRVVGYIWCLVWFAGVGNSGVGVLNTLVLLGVSMWWFGAFGKA